MQLTYPTAIEDFTLSILFSVLPWENIKITVFYISSICITRRVFVNIWPFSDVENLEILAPFYSGTHVIYYKLDVDKNYSLK